MWWKKEKRKSEVAGRLLETKDKGVCHRLVLHMHGGDMYRGSDDRFPSLLAPVSYFRSTTSRTLPTACVHK